jgi:hypothetical protein
LINEKNIREHVLTQLREGEEIIWEGKPIQKFEFVPLNFSYYDVATGPTNIFFISLAITIFFTIRFYKEGNWLSLLITMIIGGAIFLGPDILKHLRRKRTEYLLTNKRAFFKLWRYGKYSIHDIELKEVGKFHTVEFSDKTGSLHFMSNSPFNFRTHDFITGGMRHYPTFENIQNVVSLSEKLDKLKYANYR